MFIPYYKMHVVGWDCRVLPWRSPEGFRRRTSGAARERVLHASRQFHFIAQATLHNTRQGVQRHVDVVAEALGRAPALASVIINASGLPLDGRS